MKRLIALILILFTLARPIQAAPLTTHPRLWFTADDLPRLRAWANSGNPVWTAFNTALSQAIVNYNTKFFPNNAPASPFPDGGGYDYTLYNVEGYAEFFAFASLIDPNESARPTHAARARRLLMVAIAEAKKGALAGAPFRDPQFTTFNRANFWGEGWGLTVDWLQASGALSAQDLSDIRDVFLQWANLQLTAYNHPTPLNIVNSPALITTGGLRSALNNYYAGHFRMLALLPLSFDDANDPPLDPAKPATQLGNSLRSYLGHVTGAWLYQQYAVYEDAAKVRAALHVPTSGSSIGLANGGISPEGMLYGHSMGYVAETLLALQTAGYGDPTVSGPQAAFMRSTFWDQMVSGFLHNATPAARIYTGYEYMGPTYEMATYGDVLRVYIDGDVTDRFLSIGLLATATGDPARAERCRWIARTMTSGGTAAFSSHISNIWSDSNPSRAILHYLAFDPTLPAAPDPRPGLPTVHSAPTVGRVLARTDWSPQASWFTFKCTFVSIDHQIGDGGQFEFFRKGEWLLKELSGYTTDNTGSAPEFHNTLALQNTSSAGTAAQPTALQWYEPILNQHGAQWKQGQNAGDPTSTASFAADYVHCTADLRNLYNRPSSTANSNFMDVTQANRSIVWLKPDHLIVYDRATTNTAGRFKRFHLQMYSPANISGQVATTVSASGQQLFIQTLLPAAASITTAPAVLYPQRPELASPTYQLNVEDPASPADIRFLHVIQGANAGVARDVPSYVQSSSGPVFEGASVSNRLVLFPRVPLTGPVPPLTYTVPAGVTKHYLAGLAPNSGYTVSANGNTVTITSGGSTFTDAAGLLAFDPSLSSFDNWRTARFGGNFATVSGSAPLADADFDNSPTVLEYALGTDPLAANPLPQATLINSQLTLTFTRNLAAPDTTLIVETTDDLTHPWVAGSTYSLTTGDLPNTTTTAEVSRVTNGPLQTITVKDTSSSPTHFMRLCITMP